MKAIHEFPRHEDYKEYLKTYFAGLAMQGLISNIDSEKYNLGGGLVSDTAENKAKFCILLADELLKQLEQH